MHNNQRKNYFIDKNFQAKFILKFCIIVIITSLAIGGLLLFFSSNSTTVAIENTRITVKTTADFILPMIVQTIVIVTVFSAFSVILLTLFASHKISGPLYRMKKEIDKLSEGNLAANFSIRTDDQLKSLSLSLTAMSSYLKDKLSLLKKEVSELSVIIEKSSLENKKQAESKLKNLEAILHNFKGL